MSEPSRSERSRAISWLAQETISNAWLNWVHVDAGDDSIEQIATWRLRVGENDLLLTSLGNAMDPGLGTGVRRILAA